MYCRYCGKEIENGAPFCSFCGGEQNESSSPTNHPRHSIDVNSEEFHRRVSITLSILTPLSFLLPWVKIETWMIDKSWSLVGTFRFIDYVLGGNNGNLIAATLLILSPVIIWYFCAIVCTLANAVNYQKECRFAATASFVYVIAFLGLVLVYKTSPEFAWFDGDVIHFGIGIYICAILSAISYCYGYFTGPKQSGLPTTIKIYRIIRKDTK